MMLTTASRSLLAARRATGQMRASLSSLVIAEHNAGALDPSTLATVTAATAIGGDVTVLVAGGDCQAVAEEASKVQGVSKVIFANHEAYAHGIAENLCDLVIKNADGFSHILASSTNSGKNFLPRVSAKMDSAQISDITGVDSEDTFERACYAGNAITKVTSSAATKILTVRSTAFEKASAEGGSASVEDAALPDSPDCGLSTFVGDALSKSDRPELASAKTVIAGGRGLKNGENFGMLESIATKLDAAMGASRAAVDAGFVPNDMQVGQTGKVVAPDLYVAVGISGAIQHLAGMKDSKTIVAINKDPEAPIFQVADYGLVADLFKAVPEFEEKL